MPTLAHEIRSKVATPDARLYVLGVECAKAGSLEDAATELAQHVQGDVALLRALAKHYLETRIVPDMSGAAISSVRDGQRSHAEGQTFLAAPHGPVEGERGQSCHALASANLPSSPSPNDSGGATVTVPSGQIGSASPLSPSEPGSANDSEPYGHTIIAEPGSPLEGDGANHKGPFGQRVSAPSPSPIREETGQRNLVDIQSKNARLLPKPNPPRGLAAIASAQLTTYRSLFDSFKVRGGIAIGDLTVFEARKIAATNEREARILRTLCDHVGGHVPSGMTLRDVVRPEILARAVAQNMEASDVA